MKKQRGVELHVGIQTPPRLALSEYSQSNLFHLPSEHIDFPVPFDCVEAFGRSAKDIRARVSDAVDPMAEAHQPLAVRKSLQNYILRTVQRPDFKDHV